MAEIYGNTAGLGPRALKALERIYRRRVPLAQIASPELIRSLADASREVKRQVGALVHRSGAIDCVLVGDASKLMLPDIASLRGAEGRFRPLRLIHTHLFGETLTHDDIVDLTRLRLDLVCAVLLSRDGEPRSLNWAYNVPSAPGDPEARNYQTFGPTPYGGPTPNFGELISALEAEFAKRSRARPVVAKDGTAILIHVGDQRGVAALRRAEASMNELQSLAKTAGVAVVDRVIQLRSSRDPKLLLGRGKLEEVLIRAIGLDAQTLIFDCDLTPAQASGIAAETDLKVIDRSQLILDIFAQRAQTTDGKLQVELAQLKYTLPRLGTKDDALSRLTGGIGGRGPGETKLEIGRRRARDRINRLEKQLTQLEQRRAQRRRQRQREGIFTVAIVGYTNAGKSTLLNALTNAGVLAEDKLFATLDTRARRLRLPTGRDIVMTDTVGFIREMPPSLFAAFRATFEEAADADLLVEVIDGSDPEHPFHLRETEQILARLQLDELPRLRVFNKSDRLCEEGPSLGDTHESGASDGALTLSALQPHTLAALLVAIEERAARSRHFGHGVVAMPPA